MEAPFSTALGDVQVYETRQKWPTQAVFAEAELA
jgi:hypothetical protein